MQRIAGLLERVDALTPREWIVAVGIFSLLVAIAWIGRHVGQLIEATSVLQERVRIAEGNLTNAADRIEQVDERLTRLDEAVAKRCRNVEVRQDRLQSKVENLGKSWRDSGHPTKNLDHTGPMTVIDLRKP